MRRQCRASRSEHPSVFFTVEGLRSGEGITVQRAALLRTARKLMTGQVFVPGTLLGTRETTDLPLGFGEVGRCWPRSFATCGRSTRGLDSKFADANRRTEPSRDAHRIRSPTLRLRPWSTQTGDLPGPHGHAGRSSYAANPCRRR